MTMSRTFSLMIALGWTMGNLIDYTTWCNANGFMINSLDTLDVFIWLMNV